MTAEDGGGSSSAVRIFEISNRIE